jgi:hypothetical protein
MPTDNRTLDIMNLIAPDQMAYQISSNFQEWEMKRNPWLMACKEIRDYVFATDTAFTTNQMNPWKNSTHIPKLCQIRDNLAANYMAALFPNDRPIIWEGDDENSEAHDKRMAIQGYMENKMKLGGFRTEIAKCINDWIDMGNCFAMPEYVSANTTDTQTGEMIPGFIGPKAARISPLDIVFNPIARSFEDSPKIIRSIKTLGTLQADLLDHPELGYYKDVFEKLMEKRKGVIDGFKQPAQGFGGIAQGDYFKNTAFQVDGFASFLEYFKSNYVEILDFYGDYYDAKEKKLYKNAIITIIDRSMVVRNVQNPSWTGHSGIRHCGWRLRPDNLYAMGPLENLIGMQYRIDHLENAKADAFDLIIQPVMKIKGFVEDFEYGPGERIYVGEEANSDVEFMRTDLQSMISAETQIQMYEQKMEEMAGAPKQAMGFRSPGEKTAFEVQILENGSNRIFLNKTSYFEEVFMEPLLNDMLEVARRNMSPSDVIRVQDDATGAVSFTNVTKADITASGKIRPVGARHFMRNANILQNLSQWSNSHMGQDPSINVHFSGKKLARLCETLMDLDRFELVQDNVRVYEQLETQQIVASGTQVLQQQGHMPPTDPNAPQGAGPVPGLPTAPITPTNGNTMDQAALVEQRATQLTGKQGTVSGAK